MDFRQCLSAPFKSQVERQWRWTSTFCHLCNLHDEEGHVNHVSIIASADVSLNSSDIKIIYTTEISIIIVIIIVTIIIII